MEQARDLLASENPSEALPLLEEAIENGGLNPDQYAESLLLRAQCYAVAGDTDRAEADLQEAELGAPDDALLHYTRGIVLSRQGRDAESRRAFSAARKLDPTLKKR